jgi:hypothetical protein
LTLTRLALSLVWFRLRHLRCGRAVRYFDASSGGRMRMVSVACSRHHAIFRWAR